MKRSESHVSKRSTWLREAFLAPVKVYRRVISPAIPQRCKYYPTCSTYAVQAVRELGIFRGTLIAAWRLARCNPWSHGGVDELSDRTLFRARAPQAGHRSTSTRCVHDRPKAAA